MARGVTPERMAEISKPTQFSAERQPDKYRQPDSITALIKRELFSNDGWAVLEGAEIMDNEGNPTGKKVTVRVKLTTAEAAAKRILQRAMKSSDRLMEQIWERIDGKVPQDLNLGGKDGEPIVMPVPFIIKYGHEEQPKEGGQASETGGRKAG